MYNDQWGGYPDKEFLAALEPRLVRIRETLPDKAYTAGERAGLMTEEWAERLGLRPGIAVSVGAFRCPHGGSGSRRQGRDPGKESSGHLHAMWP